jgi:hypothetical protein
MPSQYAPSQPQHTLSSADGSGLVYTTSTEPLAPTRSMAEEAAPAVGVPAAAPAAPATGAAMASRATGGS